MFWFMTSHRGNLCMLMCLVFFAGQDFLHEGTGTFNHPAFLSCAVSMFSIMRAAPTPEPGKRQRRLKALTVADIEEVDLHIKEVCWIVMQVRVF